VNICILGVHNFVNNLYICIYVHLMIHQAWNGILVYRSIAITDFKKSVGFTTILEFNVEKEQY